MEHINIAVAILSLCRLQSDVHILLHQNLTLPHFVMKRHHAPPLPIGDVITFDVQCVHSSSLPWRSQGTGDAVPLGARAKMYGAHAKYYGAASVLSACLSSRRAILSYYNTI